MRIQQLCRQVHYWGSIVVALPIVIVIATGLLLQVKKDVHWVQPDEQRGGDGPPTVSFEEILAKCARVSKAGVRDWKDIERVDLRPDKALIKVTTTSGHEIQLDPTDGTVLQVAVRRSDVIEGLHDGSWFGDAGRYGVFLPAGALLLLLWITGIVLLFPLRIRFRRRIEPNRE